MKILAIDTTTKFMCLGLQNAERFCEYRVEADRKLSALLAPSIKRVLDAEGLRLSDIDYFCVGLGPGSFTGIRLGLAAIKALSFIHDKPVVGVSTLDILAKNAGATKKLIIPILDARRNLIYCSAYKIVKSALRRRSPYLLLSLKEFLERFSHQDALFLGDGLALYRKQLSAGMQNASFLDKDYWYPNAHNLMSLGLQRIRERKLSNALKIKPIYLYPKECQIKAR